MATPREHARRLEAWLEPAGDVFERALQSEVVAKCRCGAKPALCSECGAPVISQVPQRDAIDVAKHVYGMNGLGPVSRSKNENALDPGSKDLLGELIKTFYELATAEKFRCLTEIVKSLPDERVRLRAVDVVRELAASTETP